MNDHLTKDLALRAIGTIVLLAPMRKGKTLAEVLTASQMQTLQELSRIAIGGELNADEMQELADSVAEAPKADLIPFPVGGERFEVAPTDDAKLMEHGLTADEFNALTVETVAICGVTGAWYEKRKDGICYTIVSREEKEGTQAEVVQFLRDRFPI
jgi:hypothetical protein